MRNSASLIRGAAPETPRFSAVAPESLYFFWAAFTAQAVPASESALGSHLCVALSSAQVIPEWNLSTQPGNDFSFSGYNPLNSLSHARGSLHIAAVLPSLPGGLPLLPPAPIITLKNSLFAPLFASVSPPKPCFSSPKSALFAPFVPAKSIADRTFPRTSQTDANF